MTTRSDIEDMIARIALRDRDAFARLYDATSAKLLGVCLGVLKDRAQSEEVLQEVYLRVWHRAETYAVTGHSPMTWLITIARNKAIDRLRRNRVKTRPMEETAEIADSRPGPEAAAIARSEAARIGACMDELAPDRAEAVRRAYLIGDSYRELAAHFDVPLNTMRTWLRRSLMHLRACMSR